MGVKNVIRHSAWICWKDLLEFSRSKLRLIMLVLMPLFMMVMVGFIFPSGSTISDTPIALVNNDTGTLGSSFVTQLETINNQTGMMDLRNAQDFNDIKAQLQNNDINGGIIIPENFSSDIRSGKQGLITIVIDQSNPQMSLTIQAVLTKTIEAMGKQTAIYNMNNTYHVSITTATSMVTPYVVESKGIVPGEPNYFQFVAPGIIAMVVMMALMTGLPHAISYEKDIGTLDGMLSRTHQPIIHHPRKSHGADRTRNDPRVHHPDPRSRPLRRRHRRKHPARHLPHPADRVQLRRSWHPDHLVYR